MKLDAALADVYAAEAALADALFGVGECHEGDHDVFHMTGTLASAAQERMDALKPEAERYGAALERRGTGFEPTGSLLGDIRKLHLLAAEASIDWTILGQGAQATRDRELLATVTASHPETLRALRWTTTKLKEAAPQALTS